MTNLEHGIQRGAFHKHMSPAERLCVVFSQGSVDDEHPQFHCERNTVRNCTSDYRATNTLFEVYGLTYRQARAVRAANGGGFAP